MHAYTEGADVLPEDILEIIGKRLTVIIGLTSAN